jgi:hypothetical protein
MRSWVITVILALITLFSCFALLTARSIEPGWSPYVIIASFTLATLLMLPPIWRRQTNQRWRRVRYVAVVVLVTVSALIPNKTTVIKLDMPKSNTASNH